MHKLQTSERVNTVSTLHKLQTLVCDILLKGKVPEIEAWSVHCTFTCEELQIVIYQMLCA